MPAANRVVVRANRYEPERAHAIAYNYTMAERVTADLAGVLQSGDRFEVRNAQNYFAPPVLTGTFDGAQLSIPMTANDPVRPIGSPDAVAISERTGRAFNVFVVRRVGCAP